MQALMGLDGTDIRKTTAKIAISVGAAVGCCVAWAIWHTSGHVSRMTFDRVSVMPTDVV